MGSILLKLRGFIRVIPNHYGQIFTCSELYFDRKLSQLMNVYKVQYTSVMRSIEANIKMLKQREHERITFITLRRIDKMGS